jgi:hypothetical protein
MKGFQGLYKGPMTQADEFMPLDPCLAWSDFGRCGVRKKWALGSWGQEVGMPCLAFVAS